MSKVEELDKEFSIYIRKFYADHEGMVRCYTCPAILHWTQMQCGHFLRRSHMMTRWDEDNCKAQCYDCNCNRNGMPDVFEEELRCDIGDEDVDELIKKSKEIADVSDDWIQKMIYYYRAKNKELGIM